jgi:hypothetical protein
MMTAPVCPVSNSQLPYYRSLFRGGNGGQPRPTIMPVIPLASDLPSLLRTVNVMRDVLRQLSSSLVVNNVFAPSPPFARAQGDTYNADYPNWDQKDKDTTKGFVYHHAKEGLDKSSRLWVQRENRVIFENHIHDDPEFIWSYVKPLDAEGTEPLFPTANPLGG